MRAYLPRIEHGLEHEGFMPREPSLFERADSLSGNFYHAPYARAESARMSGLENDAERSHVVIRGPLEEREPLLVEERLVVDYIEHVS